MIKVLELFGGIGACTQALKKIGIDFEIADYVEIDKYAVASYNAMNNTNFEPQDITQWNKDIEVDLIMHGSPCQDFSIAGKQAGGDENSGTRSSLMYETIRIVNKLKPKYVIWENVKNVISKKHKHNFDNYINKMEELGYKSYYQVLNAKDYGIPQNRERVFTVSIRNDITIDETVKPSVAINFEREKENIIKSDKEIYQCECENGWQDNKVGLKVAPTIRANNNNTFILEDNRHFKFPEKEELKLRLKDMLEDNVDEKYYLSDSMIKYISQTGTANFKNHDSRINLDIARPLTTDQNKRAGTTNYLSEDLPENYDLSVNKIGHIPQWHQRRAIYGENGIGPTICATDYKTPKLTTHNTNVSNLRIRKLTPKECWRLMGFDDEVFEKAQKVNSNTQLYKQAGNSIVVNVLEKVLINLLEE